METLNFLETFWRLSGSHFRGVEIRRNFLIERMETFTLLRKPCHFSRRLIKRTSVLVDPSIRTFRRLVSRQRGAGASSYQVVGTFTAVVQKPNPSHAARPTRARERAPTDRRA